MRNRNRRGLYEFLDRQRTECFGWSPENRHIWTLDGYSTRWWKADANSTEEAIVIIEYLMVVYGER